VRLAPGTPLTVALAFDPSATVPAARVAMDAGLAQLEWSREVIDQKLAISPLYYPPDVGLHAARGKSFEGVHGFLADSLPEGWGQLLMRKRLAKLNIDITTLNALERLALVGNQGRGALVFEPATTPPEDVKTLDLDALADEATALLAGSESDLADTLAGLGGGSGGARPKVHVGFDGQGNISVGDGEVAAGHKAWLVKFRAPNDHADIGPIEEAYANMAEAAGLVMSEHRLIKAKKGPGYFAARRFDRPDAGGRLHMVSLAGALEARPDMPSANYDLFLRATRAITRRADDVTAAYQRMVFNVLACNRDDHTRQHSYLMGPDGDWRLAPAYDLTYALGPGGEHYMDIEGEGRRPTRAQVTTLGKKHGLNADRVAEVVDKVRAAVAAWPKFAKAAGVTAASAKEAGDAHAMVWKDFEA
jgi:serine/threonine-protein kinase HipA